MRRSVQPPPTLFDSLPFGFAQISVVPTPLGDAIHVSGQVAWDANRNVVGANDIGLQLKKCLENLATALASVGATLDQVGAIRLYIRQSHIDQGKAIRDALIQAFGDSPPCATWIGVPSLAREEFLVEVEPSIVFVSRS
ncbi:MAG: Rid family hydrolase [Hyphomicrobiaceae bacterium]|nr:Rid family hydrolase [Hyphomicrobiaceae bacterium]